jgi:uncharacterized membrane protein YidH (DUF202 family)
MEAGSATILGPDVRKTGSFTAQVPLLQFVDEPRKKAVATPSWHERILRIFLCDKFDCARRELSKGLDEKREKKLRAKLAHVDRELAEAMEARLNRLDVRHGSYTLGDALFGFRHEAVDALEKLVSACEEAGVTSENMQRFLSAFISHFLAVRVPNATSARALIIADRENRCARNGLRDELMDWMGEFKAHRAGIRAFLGWARTNAIPLILASVFLLSFGLIAFFPNIGLRGWTTEKGNTLGLAIALLGALATVCQLIRR